MPQARELNRNTRFLLIFWISLHFNSKPTQRARDAPSEVGQSAICRQRPTAFVAPRPVYYGLPRVSGGRLTVSEVWAKWEGQVINGIWPLRRLLSGADRSGVFLTEDQARNLPNAALKLVPATSTRS